MNSVLQRVCRPSSWVSSPRVLGELHAVEFGRMAESMGRVDPARPVDDGLCETWCRCMAEEWLLARIAGIDPDSGWLETLGEVRPFGPKGPGLAELVEVPAWVAVVPVDEPGRTAGSLRRIWGMEMAAAGMPLEGAGDFEEALFVGGGAMPAGRSWTLGARLAGRCRSERRADLQYQLAREWIVTGEVRGDRVDGVVTGNKPVVPPGRRWLVPQADSAGFEAVRPLHRAATADEAWSILRGSGTVAGEVETWWGEVGEMHMLVSQAMRPLVASILLARPGRIILWHSRDPERSLRQTGILEALCESAELEEFLGRKPGCERRQLPDDDIAAAERVLHEAGLAEATDQPRLGNITGGNRLMGMAMANVARVNPSLWLVYREIGLSVGELVLLRYEQGLARSCRLVAESPADGIDWEFLESQTPRGTVDRLEDLLGAFI